MLCQPLLRRVIPSALLFVVVVFLIKSARAETKTWSPELVIDTSWQDADNWLPSGVPDGADDVVIDIDRTVVLNDNTDLVNSVDMSNGGTLETNGHRLWVNDTSNSGSVVLSGSSTTLRVEPSSESIDADLDDLDVNSGAMLLMDGGLAKSDNAVDVNAGGRIEGHGIISTLDLNQPNFINDGNIKPTGGTLTINSAGGDDFGEDQTLDLDGVNENGVLNVISGSSELVVSGFPSRLGSSPDWFSGEIFIGAGNSVSFDTIGDNGWAIDGTVNFDGALGTATLSASAAQGDDIDLLGVTNVNSGTAVIRGRSDIGPDGILNIADNAELRVEGPMDIRGEFNPQGNGSTWVVAHNVDVEEQPLGGFDWDGPGGATTIIEPGGVLLITPDVQRVDTGNNTFDGTLRIIDGAVGVSHADGQWSMDGDLELINGNLGGSAVMSIDSPSGVTGFGDIHSPVINNTAIVAETDTLLLDNAGSDWDGVSEVGQLTAVDGSLELQDDLDFSFNGTAQIGTGEQLLTNGFGLQFEPDSTLQLDGGTYRTTHATAFAGAVNVTADVDVFAENTDLTFTDDSTTTITTGGILDLEGDTRIENGATMTGDGELKIGHNDDLVLEDGVSLSVSVRNDGRLKIGDSPGKATVDAFTQTGLGRWQVEIGGTGAATPDFDQLAVNNTADLSGALEVQLIDNFMPDMVDTFTILTAANVVGSFSNVLDGQRLDTVGGEGSFLVSYDGATNAVVLSAFFLFGDLDCDGDADFDDIDDFVLALNMPQEYENQVGVPPAAKGDADGDGDLDFDDIDDFVGILNNPHSAAAQTIPEPGTAALLVVATSICCARRLCRAVRLRPARSHAGWRGGQRPRDELTLFSASV